MIVKCIKIISPATGKDLGERSDCLIRGKAYTVFAIRYSPYSKTVQILLQSENYGDPIFFDIDHFEVISNKLSSYWIFGKDEDGFICFMPQEWFKDGFGEGIDSGDESSMSLYRKYRDLMVQEDPIRGIMKAV